MKRPGSVRSGASGCYRQPGWGIIAEWIGWSVDIQPRNARSARMKNHLTISLQQPWASLCVIGAQSYVTRSRPPAAAAIGARIAIHAAKRPVAADYLDTSTREAVDEALGRTDWTADLALGAIVGTVILRGAYHIAAYDPRGHWATYDRVVGSAPRDHVARRLKVDLLGNYRPGRWAWLIEEPKPFALVYPARGWRGWWTWCRPATDCDLPSAASRHAGTSHGC